MRDVRVLVAAIALFCASTVAQFDRKASEFPIEAVSEPPLVETKLFKIVREEARNVELPPASIVVGILSAPTHFDERAAVRASWMQFQSLTDPKLNQLSIAEKKSIVVRFIIGDSSDSIVENSLNAESAQNRDIVRVPLVESYFNLTLKTGEFFKWAHDSYNFKWAFKCDDDSFVRIDLLLEELLKNHRTTPMLYMGKIWTGTPTDRRIDAVTPWKQYPPFAAGAGYLLSYDLVSYIVRNYQMLHTYPLEDVAVGSWIAALKVTYVDHPHFHSLPEGCDKDMIVQNPANITVMKETFLNAVMGIPCHNKPDPFDRKTENVTDHVLSELGIPKTAGDQSMLDVDSNVMVDDMSLAREDASEVADGMNAGLMNGNMPSSEAIFDMNRAGTNVNELASSVVGRMNGKAQSDENLL